MINDYKMLKELDTEFILQNYDNHKTLSEYVESFVSPDDIKLRKLLEKISFKDWIDVEPSDYDPNYNCISYSEFSKKLLNDDTFGNLYLSLKSLSNYEDTYFEKDREKLWDDLIHHNNSKSFYNNYLYSEKIKWILEAQKNITIVEKVFKEKVLKRYDVL